MEEAEKEGGVSGRPALTWLQGGAHVVVGVPARSPYGDTVGNVICGDSEQKEVEGTKKTWKGKN